MIGTTDVDLMVDQADQSGEIHEISTLKIRACGAASASIFIASQQVSSTPQWPTTHQMNGATDVGLEADQADRYGDLQEISPLQARTSFQNVGGPAGNMSNSGVPVTTLMIRATRFGFHGFAESRKGHMLPQGCVGGQRNMRNVGRNIANVGECPSAFSSGFGLYGYQTTSLPVSASVASSIDVSSCFASPVAATNESRPSSSADGAIGLFLDHKDLEFLLSSD